MKIIKLTFWENPTPIQPRWDCEIVSRDKDGTKTHNRVINITENEAVKLVREAFKNPKGE